MSETKETSDKPARPARKPLSLKGTVESGHVRQNFSHGRSKSVLVEKKRSKRVFTPGETPTTATAAPAAPEVEAKPAPKVAKPAAKRPAAPAADAAKSAVARPAGKQLSDGELDARARALQAARVRQAEEEEQARERARLEAEERKKREALEALRQKEEAERRAREPEPEPAPEPPPPPKAEAPAKPAARQPAGKPASRASEARPAPARRPGDRNMNEEPDRPKRASSGGAPVKRGGPAQRQPAKPAGDRRVRGKLTVTNAFNDEQRERSLASLKRKREREKQRAMGITTTREKIAREVTIPEVITIQELANRMAERAVDVIKFLMKEGEMHKMNDVIDVDMAELIVQEFGHTAKRVSEADVEVGLSGVDDEPDDMAPRAPVVTIMGHVDHGKTSLLDAIRQANVVSGEAGGITQHIGAYQVDAPTGDKVTFIDTPGHAAFTEMRARGAKVTDIVVLVVAADDSVMPQTIEAINHAKAAEVPMIVAINKMDLPAADPTKVRTELLQHEVVVESMSGDTLEVEVSALKKQGLDKLLEAISLQAELLDLQANPDRSADGIVIEAKLERGRGPVGTVLVQRGTLAVGDIVVAGSSWGKVRALIDDHGKHTVKAGPSVPVEVLGFDSAPAAGDQLNVVESEARAREITEYRQRKLRDTLGSAGATRSLEQMMQSLKDDGKKEFTLLVKADVQGSAEAIAGALAKLGTDEVEARIIHSGVGGITESDISLANASNAIIVGFNVRANQQAKAAAEQDGIEIRYYNIIYDLVDDVKAAMSGLLAPTIKENFIGYAEILEVFNITKVGKVAGCRVTEGRVERGAGVRLLRDNVVIHQGKLSTLKRFKDEVKEVQVGQECGMAFEKYEDLRKGDMIECFTTETIERTL
ncbi:MAG: translation initiation factor IF-2 [Pseudomonadota bacterium]